MKTIFPDFFQRNNVVIGCEPHWQGDGSPSRTVESILTNLTGGEFVTKKYKIILLEKVVKYPSPSKDWL